MEEKVDDIKIEESETGADKRTLFTQQMRAVTRNIHNISDHLVNAKLGVTMSDDSVWAEGLLVFYEIFAFLEQALANHSDSLLGDLLIPGLARKEALESDLSHYLGEDWKENYCVRPEVQQYLAHLGSLEKEQPYLLLPYVYHLYMALFSGGQVMLAKRSMLGGAGDTGGAVLYFGGVALGTLKKQMRSATNEVAEQLDEETREAILKESVEVFRMNNVIIGSVQGVDRVLKRRLLKMLIALVLCMLFIFAWMSQAEREEEQRDLTVDEGRVEL